MNNTYFEADQTTPGPSYSGGEIDTLSAELKGEKNDTQVADPFVSFVSRIANGESPVVKTIIYRWVKEGLVEKIGSNLWRKYKKS